MQPVQPAYQDPAPQDPPRFPAWLDPAVVPTEPTADVRKAAARYLLRNPAWPVDRRDEQAFEHVLAWERFVAMRRYELKRAEWHVLRRGGFTMRLYRADDGPHATIAALRDAAAELQEVAVEVAAEAVEERQQEQQRHQRQQPPTPDWQRLSPIAALDVLMSRMSEE